MTGRLKNSIVDNLSSNMEYLNQFKNEQPLDMYHESTNLRVNHNDAEMSEVKDKAKTVTDTTMKTSAREKSLKINIKYMEKEPKISSGNTKVKLYNEITSEVREIIETQEKIRK